VIIKDSGIGIAEDELPHIFDRFYRVEKSRSKATGALD
jgi:two-component system phosphate regulon sensor histidine kinase PhoR